MDAFRAEDDFLLCGVNVLDARGSGDVSPAGFLFVRYKDGEGEAALASSGSILLSVSLASSPIISSYPLRAL